MSPIIFTKFIVLLIIDSKVNWLNLLVLQTTAQSLFGQFICTCSSCWTC